MIYFLFTNKIKKPILFFSLLILAIHILFLLFRTNTFPINQSTNIANINTVEKIRIYFRAFANFAVAFIFFKIYINLKLRLNKQNTYHQNIKKWINTSLFIVTFGGITNVLMINLRNNTNIDFEKISILIIDMLICLNILFRPTIINKVRLDISLSNLFNKNCEKEIDQETFFNEFFIKSYYTRNSTSLEDLGGLLGVDSNVLNNFIFLKYGYSLTDLVNKSRIELFTEMIQKGTPKDVTIEAMAKTVGFGSRQSLTRSFKKFHGGNPSDLIKMYE
jgi:AraC-like DNA-binding protein